jgi:hypothetical protein
LHRRFRRRILSPPTDPTRHVVTQARRSRAAPVRRPAPGPLDSPCSKTRRAPTFSRDRAKKRVGRSPPGATDPGIPVTRLTSPCSVWSTPPGVWPWQVPNR